MSSRFSRSIGRECLKCIYYENDINKATELYNTATVLAEAFGDQVFIKNLKMEINKDLNTSNESK